MINGFAFYFKQDWIHTTAGSLMEKNDHVGPISSIMRVLTSRDQYLRSGSDNIKETTALTPLAAETANQAQKDIALEARKIQYDDQILTISLKTMLIETLP